jgi:hypothetical protein
MGGIAMSFVESPSSSVVLLQMYFDNTWLADGTGVIYERASKPYLATAWHNLSGRHSETLVALSSQKSLPNRMVMHLPLAFNVDGQRQVMRFPFSAPLENEDRALYYVHPDGWPRRDVAVLPLDLTRAYEMELETADGKIPASQVLGNMRVSNALATLCPIQGCLGGFAQYGNNSAAFLDEGDDLFVLGYPRGIYDDFKLPLWKRATVAYSPKLGWRRESRFLIDCASREGMSGAPVVSYSKSGNVPFGGMRYRGAGPSAILRGIYVGRLIDVETPVNDRLFEAQIGTVWKREVLDEIIDEAVFGPHTVDIGASEREIDAAIAASWPVEGDLADKIGQNENYARMMLGAVMRRLNGNANSHIVLKRVKQHAEKISSGPG